MGDASGQPSPLRPRAAGHSVPLLLPGRGVNRRPTGDLTSGRSAVRSRLGQGALAMPRAQVDQLIVRLGERGGSRAVSGDGGAAQPGRAGLRTRGRDGSAARRSGSPLVERADLPTITRSAGHSRAASRMAGPTSPESSSVSTTRPAARAIADTRENRRGCQRPAHVRGRLAAGRFERGVEHVVSADMHGAQLDV